MRLFGGMNVPAERCGYMFGYGMDRDEDGHTTLRCAGDRAESVGRLTYTGAGLYRLPLAANVTNSAGALEQRPAVSFSFFIHSLIY